MSVEQIEATIEAMPVSERQEFARWFDEHRNKLLTDAPEDFSEEQKTELLRRRQEYDEHPERFVSMDKKSLDQMFSRIRKNVAARISSAR